MIGEVEKKNLYDAVVCGDAAKVKEWLNKNPDLVGEVSFACSRNVLHIAAMHGHQSIVEALASYRLPARDSESQNSTPLHEQESIVEIESGHGGVTDSGAGAGASLEVNPSVVEVLESRRQLARDLDSRNSTALHIAASQGSVEVASKLLSMAPETLWWRDCHGWNPVHIAAIHGHVEILRELLRSNLSPAMERVHRGETVLHLCVKHNQLDALKSLLYTFRELVCAKDDDGETILHLAVKLKQFQTIEYLVEQTKIDKQAQNSMGKTALEILNESPYAYRYPEVEKLLNNPSTPKLSKVFPNLTDTTMVVVVLIATMAFQAAVSPPGGVWQEHTTSHKAGDAVMASTHPKLYRQFVRANTAAFVSSIITIFLITTRQPSGRILFLLISLFAMWLSLASISLSYGASIMAVSPHTETRSLVPVIIIVVAVSVGIIGFIFVYNIIRGCFRWTGNICFSFLSSLLSLCLRESQ